MINQFTDLYQHGRHVARVIDGAIRLQLIGKHWHQPLLISQSHFQAIVMPMTDKPGNDPLRVRSW